MTGQVSPRLTLLLEALHCEPPVAGYAPSSCRNPARCFPPLRAVPLLGSALRKAATDGSGFQG
jgi:hypothetical protein